MQEMDHCDIEFKGSVWLAHRTDPSPAGVVWIETDHTGTKTEVCDTFVFSLKKTSSTVHETRIMIFNISLVAYNKKMDSDSTQLSYGEI